MSVEIPADLQPFVRHAIATGGFANEQELVVELLRLAAGSLDGYRQMKEGVKRSVEDEQAGRVEEANFERARQQVQDEFDAHNQSI